MVNRGQPLSWIARTAEFVHQAQLRAGVVERLGLAWVPGQKAWADRVGVPREAVEVFSQAPLPDHHRAALAEVSGGKAAQMTMLATCAAKPVAVEESLLRARWLAGSFATEPTLGLPAPATVRWPCWLASTMPASGRACCGRVSD